MSYSARPSPSPVVAALVAAGVVGRDDRVLDLGCGSGTDAVALARWGVHRVVGVDVDRRALASARRRAKAARVANRAEFREASVLALPFEDGAFDVALDTLLVNNLRGKDVERYAAEAHRVLAPGARLVLQERMHRWAHDAGGRHVLPLPPLAARFDFGPTTTTAVPERPLGPRDPPYARVAVSVGRRR